MTFGAAASELIGSIGVHVVACLMGNLSSAAAPPRLPAVASQPRNQADSPDAVYETYQVPLGLAKEINRMCSEFQKLQHAVQSGASLPSDAVFQVDLLQLLRLTDPQNADLIDQASLPANQAASRPANQALAQSAAYLPHRHVQNSARSRDPSLPLILKLDKSQLFLLQDDSGRSALSDSGTSLKDSGHAALSDSGASLKSSYRPKPSFVAQADESYVAAAAAPELRPRERLAAMAKTMNSSDAPQPVGTQNSGRQHAPQQHHVGANAAFSDPVNRSLVQGPGSETRSPQLRYSASSAPNSDLTFGSPPLEASSAPLGNSGLRSAGRSYAPMGSRSNVGSVESQVGPVSATPSSSRARFLVVPEPGDIDFGNDADARFASETSSPNSTGALLISQLGSQSLVSDDVEAKRKILAEVRRRRFCLFTPARPNSAHQVRRKIEQKHADRRKRQSESTR
jgi:hypothetical protein